MATKTVRTAGQGFGFEETNQTALFVWSIGWGFSSQWFQEQVAGGVMFLQPAMLAHRIVSRSRGAGAGKKSDVVTTIVPVMRRSN